MGKLQEIFSSTYSLEWSEEEYDMVPNTNFLDLMEKYDETFFEENQLATFIAIASGGAYYFTFSQTTLSENALIIEIVHEYTGLMGTEALVPRLAITEIEKVPAETEISFAVTNRG